MAELNVVVEVEQLASSTAVIYTASTSPNTKALVTFSLATNTSSTNTTFTITVTPSGGSAATYIDARTIPGKKNDFVSDILGMRLDPGDAISAFASDASRINLKLAILEST